MTIYKRIKDTVTALDAAQMYGLNVRSNGMTNCPFHEDHKAVSPKSFGNYMCQNEKQLNLERSNNVRNRDGHRVWGFWGMEPVVKLYV